jgi:recombinational DNA repair protein (RecF pathway)
LLDHALTWLCEETDLDLVDRFYEQHLLGLAGFRPELFRCVGEHEHEEHEYKYKRHKYEEGHEILLRSRAADEEAHEDRANHLPYGFDPEHGGVLCPDCYEAQKRRPEVVALSPNGLAFLQDCQRGPYTTRLRKLHISPALHAEAERVMQHYITYHLERNVSSGAFLRKLKRETITTR